MTDSAQHHETINDRLRDVQGNVVGFNKDHMRLMFVNFTDAVTGRACIAEMIPQISTGYEVLGFNDLYKEVRARRHGDRGIIQAAWTNLWISHDGLLVLEAPGLDAFPGEFSEGMAARAARIGDVGRSEASQWATPFIGGAMVHAVVVLAADDPRDLEDRGARLLEILGQHSVAVVATQDGNVREGDNKGHEHFGFKDGISQPSIEGFTTTSMKDPAVPAGEFIIGYPDADGNVSGQPPQTPPPPSPYNPEPPPLQQPMPPWTRNGSFVAYRRLRQDVAGFRASMRDQSGAVSLTEGQLGAKVVGRWPSGAPLERVPGEPREPDPAVEDPSTVYPKVLDDDKINAFDYSKDPDGLTVPRAAHIRKVNPRADQLPDGDKSTRHRMLRRGIPYGPEFQEGESPYGEVVPDTEDRGLLFVSYQSSIERSFEFVQLRWANAPDFQKPGDGQDPIASQNTDPRAFTLPPDHHLDFAAWVFTTGGGYFFAPSISGLGVLAQAPTSSA